ncbi:hypothetical protein BC831DRAFT_440821 [Entophlyctis helioformis]|nr:hypothetical protein BC831DRAFT_440821 [Entophlyctis helioformis]
MRDGRRAALGPASPHSNDGSDDGSGQRETAVAADDDDKDTMDLLNDAARSLVAEMRRRVPSASSTGTSTGTLGDATGHDHRDRDRDAWMLDDYGLADHELAELTRPPSAELIRGGSDNSVCDGLSGHRHVQQRSTESPSHASASMAPLQLSLYNTQGSTVGSSTLWNVFVNGAGSEGSEGSAGSTGNGISADIAAAEHAVLPDEHGNQAGHEQQDRTDESDGSQEWLAMLADHDTQAKPSEQQGLEAAAVTGGSPGIANSSAGQTDMLGELEARLEAIIGQHMHAMRAQVHAVIQDTRRRLGLHRRATALHPTPHLSEHAAAGGAAVQGDSQPDRPDGRDGCAGRAECGDGIVQTPPQRGGSGLGGRLVEEALELAV